MIYKKSLKEGEDEIREQENRQDKTIQAAKTKRVEVERDKPEEAQLIQKLLTLCAKAWMTYTEGVG